MSDRQVELPSRDEVRVAIAGVLGWNIDTAPEWPEQVRDEHNALLKVARAYERGQLQELLIDPPTASVSAQIARQAVEELINKPLRERSATPPTEEDR